MRKSTLLRWLLGLFFVASVFVSFAQATELDAFLSLEPSRPVYYHEIKGNSSETQAKTPGKTLVLLPGLNQAFPTDYTVLGALAHQGYNLLITATSAHWQSLAYLPPLTKPFYEDHELSAKDFMVETEAIIQKTQAPQPVLISLSYSSALAVHSHLPQIYVAPLVKPSESSPAAAAAAAAWEAGLALNIFYGPSLIRQFRDTNYNIFWSSVYASDLKDNPQAFGPNPNRDQILSGYLRISRSTEDFNLAEAITSTEGAQSQPGFDFVLAENELQSRLRGQIEVAQNASQKKPTRVLLVRHSEHNIPSSQPAGYVQALDFLLETPRGRDSLQVGVIETSGAQAIRWLNPSEVEKLFKGIRLLSDVAVKSDLSFFFGK